MSAEAADRVREATGDLFSGLGLEFIDVELSRDGGRLHLRMYIDREGGVTVDDCAKVSHLVEKVIDREGIISEAYVFEVMSPGLDRKLKRTEDFARSVGKRVKVKLKQPFEGRGEYSGVLLGAGEDLITLDVGIEVLELKRDGLSGAMLDPELPW